MTTVLIPLRLARGANNREHPMQRHRRVKRERSAVGLVLNVHVRPALPCFVVLRRISPSKGLDDDNLVGSLKAARDEVARWLGVDDADARVGWAYGQRRGEWGCEIEVKGGSSNAGLQEQGRAEGSDQAAAGSGVRAVQRQGVVPRKGKLARAVPQVLPGAADPEEAEVESRGRRAGSKVAS